MAKRPRRSARKSVASRHPAATVPASGPFIQVPAGGTATVIVDVGPMAVPYAVSYAGATIIKSLVDRAKPLPLLPGEQVLGWAFTHMEKGWHHAIGVSVNGGVPVVLESMSEANRDDDVSVNFAVIVLLGDE